jgi:hypothetical protein
MTDLEKLASLTVHFTPVSRVRRRQIACLICQHLQQIGAKTAEAVQIAASIGALPGDEIPAAIVRNFEARA